jgi:AraC-like DNA-binding protein
MLFKPREISVPSTEKVFIEKLTGLIEQNMSNEKFSVDKLSFEMGLSRSQLHRKLKAITDQSTTEFVRNFRLQRAAHLIKQGSGNMAEIAYAVGFSSQAYFTKSFTEFFGLPPGEYRRQIQPEKPA